MVAQEQQGQMQFSEAEMHKQLHSTQVEMRAMYSFVLDDIQIILLEIKELRQI
jgi:hypothetical protein